MAEHCALCGEPAVTEIVVRAAARAGGRLVKASQTAPACAAHADAATPQQRAAARRSAQVPGQTAFDIDEAA